MCKGLRVCCGVTSIYLLILAFIFTVLSVTMFRPRGLDIIARPTGVDNVVSCLLNGTKFVKLGMNLSIYNPNKGDFKFNNSTAYVDYYGTPVAQVPIAGDYIPGYGDINLISFAELNARKVTTSPNFTGDLLAGMFNLTSTAVLHGKLRVFKVLNLGATTVGVCDISVYIDSPRVESNCRSKIKMFKR